MLVTRPTSAINIGDINQEVDWQISDVDNAKESVVVIIARPTYNLYIKMFSIKK